MTHVTQDPVSVTVALARFASQMTYGDVPPKVTEAVRRDFAASIARAARASADGLANKSLAFMPGISGKSICFPMFLSRSTDPVHAALVNGLLIGANHSVGSSDEPLTPAIWASALSVSQISPADGKRLVAAVAVGWEIATRLRLGLGIDHEDRGYWCPATCGTFGAAVTASYLMGLKYEDMLNVLGLAASFAGGLGQNDGEGRGLLIGLAAATGVELAFMAQAGLSGPPDAIEGSQGFGGAVSNTFHAAAVIDALGKDWMTISAASRDEPDPTSGLREQMASLRPEFDVGRWLSAAASLEKIGSISEVLIS